MKKILSNIVLLPKRIDSFFKSRTIDSEHIIGMIYAFLYLLPFMINKLVFVIVNWVFSYFPLSILTIPMIMFIINLILFMYLIKTVVRLFKERRFLLVIILLYLVFAFLLAVVFWFGSIFLGLAVSIQIFLQDINKSNELLNMVNTYTQNYQNMNDNFESSARIGANVIQFLGVSYFLNMFVPSKYQSIDIAPQKKFTRFLIKVSYLVLPILFFIIFSTVDKDSFTLIAIIGAIITWFLSPQNMISLLNRSTIITDGDIKPEVINQIKILQLILWLIEISWGISILIFGTYSAIERLLIASGILFVGVVFFKIRQRYIKTYSEEWLRKTLKKESAQKILEEIAIDKTEGEKKQ